MQSSKECIQMHIPFEYAFPPWLIITGYG